jgi:AcrR family transcriptional regulator
MPIKKRAQRMSPEQRREQILDSAVKLVVKRGLSSCTLETVAIQAKISKPLIYRYFPRLDDLFKALVGREYRYLRGRGLNILPRNVPFEEIIYRSTLRGLEYLYDRGPIMRVLASDRSVSRLVKRQDRDERGVISDYFTKRCMEVYALPRDVARVCAVMTSNAPILSIRALKSGGISAQRAAEIWSDFIVGGMNALQRQFGKLERKARSRAKSGLGRKPKAAAPPWK